MKYLLLYIVLLPAMMLSQDSFLQAEDFFQQEKFGIAKPLFQEYLEENPTHKKTREYLGDIAGFSRDWDLAIFYYEDLMHEETRNANYHFKYGGALGMKALEINRFQALTYVGEIREAFEKAVNLDPKHIEAHWALVEYYIQLPGIIGGSERKAMQYASLLGKISPVDGYLANGYIAEYSDRTKDAEEFYKKAIEIGGSPHTYEKLSNLYENNNQPGEAIKITTKAFEIHKRNQLNYQIGKIAAQYNLEAEKGIRCLHKYIEHYSIKDGVPKDWAYYRLAQIYKNIGDKKIALQWIDKALKDRPNFKEAMEERSIILGM